MGKGEKNDEVPLQSLMIVSFLFILPLSSSIFSTEVISVKLSLDALIPFLYPHPHRNNSTCWCQLSIPIALMSSLLLFFYDLHDNPANPSPFFFLIQILSVF